MTPSTHRRAVALLAVVSAVALLPWTANLAASLPATYVAANWNLTWVGFDVALLSALLAAGVALWRRHPSAPALAVLAATLLGCDAWFDVTTASGTDLTGSLAAAVLLELPLAGVLGLGAATASRRRQLAGLTSGS